MTHRKRILLLIIIMIIIATAVTGIALLTLYKTAFEQQRERLVETAQSQARLLEAVARFNAQYSTDDIPGGSLAATLSQIKDAHDHFKGFGKTGEFTLAKRDDNWIVFLLSHRHYDLENPEPVFFSSEIAEPMRLALSGKSGTIVGLDYRGVMVLAAYEPVKELNCGIVAKIDLSEIREPFINTGLLTAGGTLALIILGIVLFQRIGNPLVESIEKSARKYRTLFNSASDAIFIHDLEGHFLEVNQAASEILGYSIEELLTITPMDIDSPDYAALVPRRFEKLKKENHIMIESAHVTKDGRTIPVEINARIIDYGGKPAVLSIARDITERKKTEEALKKAHDELEKRVKERTAELAKTNDVLNAINTVFKEALECETEEKLSRTCLTVSEELTGSKFGFIGELNQSGLLDKIVWGGIGWEACKIEESEVSFLTKNMELRGILGRVLKDEKSLIVNDHAFHPDSVGSPEGHPPITAFLGIPLKRAGETIGIIALANKESGYDIDDQKAVENLSVAIMEVMERKQAEEALRSSEERFRDFFDNAPIGFHIFGPNSIITNINQAELDMIGYSREEIVGK